MGINAEEGVQVPDDDFGFIKTETTSLARAAPAAVKHPYFFYIYTTDVTNLEGEITGAFSRAMPHEAFELLKSTTDDGRERFSVHIVDYAMLPAPDENKKLYITKREIRDDMIDIDRHLREAAAGRGVRPLANNSNAADQAEFSKFESVIARRFVFSAS